jgi:ATP-dependent DNA helicase RecG
MKAESQNIEWKESWRDDYLKWICGFANAQGGKIYIGINDKGEVKGLSEAKKLLDEIPNKTKNHLGILVDVNLKTKAKKSYIEIIVEPYPNPISYSGEYHYRSGSTKQVLRGPTLDKFLLQKQGKRWDGVPIPKVKPTDLDPLAFKYFKEKATQSNRMSTEMLKVKNELLLENLRLKAEDNYLKRAAVLLFHKDPEKYISGAFVKIGYFNSDDTLAFQDEIHGNLFTQSEQTMDLLLTKYLKAFVSYEGLNRVEKYPLPEAALREALLNAIAHKDYSGGTPIQIKVYSNKVIIWNEGELPQDWTIKNLKSQHPSKPYNPDIAITFSKAGLIEAWGQGTIRIIDECKKNKILTPSFNYGSSGFSIVFNFRSSEIIEEIKIKPKEYRFEEEVLSIICEKNNITIDELVAFTKKSKITVRRALDKLKVEKKIKRTGSDKVGHWDVLL